jgi:hypothetical protein
MKTRNTSQPTDPDQVGSLAAIKRAALRARELARQMNTPCYVMRDGRIIDISHESLPISGQDRPSPVRP